MLLYMIRDNTTGLWYKRGSDYATTWVSKEEASIWTTRTGANACKGTITRRNKQNARRKYETIQRDPEVVELDVYERGAVTLVENYAQSWVALYLNEKLIRCFSTTMPRGVDIDWKDLLEPFGIEARYMTSFQKTSPPENLANLQ